MHRGRVVRVMNGALLGATSLLRWAPGAVINRITQGHRRSVTRGRETWSVLGIMLATRAGSARFLKLVSFPKRDSGEDFSPET